MPTNMTADDVHPCERALRMAWRVRLTGAEEARLDSHKRAWPGSSALAALSALWADLT
jgi:hypothetical protein